MPTCPKCVVDRLTSEIQYRRITNLEDLQPLEHMAARGHIQMVKEHIGDQRAVVVGATEGKKPVGLLIAVIESKHSADIKSVYVKKDYRRRGVASEMIGFTEKLCRRGGVESVYVGVHLPSQSQPIRGVVRKRGWPDEPRRLRYLMSACSEEMTLESAPWRKRELSDPRLETFPWHKVKRSDLRQLKAVYESDDCWFDKKLSPLVDNTYIYKPLSIGLRFDGEVIGWSVAHRFKKGPVVFSIMFAKRMPEYPLAGLKLLQETADRLIDLSKGPPIPLMCAIVDGNKFFQFFERKVFRYLPTQVSEIDVYSLELNPRRCIVETLS